MGKFSADVARFAQKVKVESDAQLRKVVLDMFSRIVARTPVDTGRARGNWSLSFGEIPSAPILDTLNPSGDITGALQSRDDIRIGNTVWIANGLPYIRRLEYGWSKQAPQGMVRITAMEFGEIVSGA